MLSRPYTIVDNQPCYILDTNDASSSAGSLFVTFKGTRFMVCPMSIKSFPTEKLMYAGCKMVLSFSNPAVVTRDDILEYPFGELRLVTRVQYPSFDVDRVPVCVPDSYDGIIAISDYVFGPDHRELCELISIERLRCEMLTEKYDEGVFDVSKVEFQEYVELVNSGSSDTSSISKEMLEALGEDIVCGKNYVVDV